jgi:hypothetical protein
MAGNHGGYRPGSGKKKGSTNVNMAKAQVLAEAREKHAAIIDDDAINSMTPLEVMLLCMKLSIKDQEWDKASARASLCAPYLHPKLASTEITATVNNAAEELSDEQLAAILAQVSIISQHDDSTQ